MATIVFPEHLLPHTNGERQVEIAAETYRDVLLQLESRWPGIRQILDKCAVAIDGQIYQDAFLEPLQPDSELFVMSRIEGG